MTYSLTINPRQTHAVVAATDFYARIGLGQLEVLLEQPAFRKLDQDAMREARSLITGLKCLLGLPPDGSHGIGSRDVPEDYRIAFDVRTVLRHRLAWDRAGNPPQRDLAMMPEVAYDVPHQFADEPLPVVSST